MFGYCKRIESMVPANVHPEFVSTYVLCRHCLNLGCSVDAKRNVVLSLCISTSVFRMLLFSEFRSSCAFD